MLRKRIEKYVNASILKDECRKIGANLITAGIVGVFINHAVGSRFSVMFWTCGWITFAGLLCLFFGAISWSEKI